MENINGRGKSRGDTDGGLNRKGDFAQWTDRSAGPAPKPYIFPPQVTKSSPGSPTVLVTDGGGPPSTVQGPGEPVCKVCTANCTANFGLIVSTVADSLCPCHHADYHVNPLSPHNGDFSRDRRFSACSPHRLSAITREIMCAVFLSRLRLWSTWSAQYWCRAQLALSRKHRRRPPRQVRSSSETRCSRHIPYNLETVHR